VRAKSASSNIAVCEAPPHAVEIVEFAFSYDEVHWSADKITFSYADVQDFGEIIKFLGGLLVVLLVCGIGFFVYCQFNVGKDDKYQGLTPLVDNIDTTDDEKEPFLVKKRGHAD
jgi:hypothetical protein